MTFEVEVGDRVRTVKVQREGLVLRVEANGHTHMVDARRVGDATLSLLLGSENGVTPVRSADVGLAAQAAPGGFDVYVAGRTISLNIRAAGTIGRQRREPGSSHGVGPQRIAAPMPGKIVRLLVRAGEEVVARQSLVVVEAMKMENELRASRPGRVREVAVAEGQSVDAGAVLMVVE